MYKSRGARRQAGARAVLGRGSGDDDNCNECCFWILVVFMFLMMINRYMTANSTNLIPN
jgi:hypothetical protein